MKIFLYLLVSIFLNAKSYAQEGFRERRHPSQFNRFIEQPSISWALQSFDSIRFNKVNLNALLRYRVKNKEIKATNQISYGRYDDIRYESLQELYALRFPHDGDTMPIYDSLGNLVSDINYSQPAEYLNDKFDSVSYDLVYVDEVIYVAKGKLNIYIPYISPAYPIITSMGVRLGFGYYFNSSFNFKNTYRGKKTDKTYILGQSVKEIIFDSVARADILKQLYGNNMLDEIWKDLTNHKIYRITDSSEFPVSDMSVETYSPKYDLHGNLTGWVVSGTQALLSSAISKVNLTLEWKYNKPRNIVFCEIKEITLIGNYLTKTGEAQGIRPLFKIVW